MDTDMFRSVVQYRHTDDGRIEVDVHQPCGFEEYEPGKIRTVTRVIAAMSMGPDQLDMIADEMKICARRAREARRPDNPVAAQGSGSIEEDEAS